MFLKKSIFSILYAVIIVSFTVYSLLDIFVIKRVYAVTTVESSSASQGESSSSVSSSILDSSTSSDGSISDNSSDGNLSSGSSSSGSSTSSGTSSSGSSVFTSTPIITDSSYSDANVSIVITEYREYDTSIYVADIVVSSPEYLKTAFAQDSYGRNITEKTSAIASDNNAILAINGDYYGTRTSGYVIRNGVLYRSSVSSGQEDLAIMSDGSFKIISESDITAAQLLRDGARQVLSFGPALITGGSVAISQNEEVGKSMASNPRTAIGIIDNCHYLFVVSDGRTSESEGLSLYELAQFMRGLGAETVYNLDGGGSSTMYFNGDIINNPTTNGTIKERSVSDIVYIG